jgi:NitT/TauT family transport system permease protein
MFRRAIGPIVVLLLWHLASTYGWIDSRFVPAPLTVVNSLSEWMFGTPGAGPYSGTWFSHAGNSFYRVIGGFLIASAFGVVLGCIIGWSRLCSDLLDPIIQIIRPIPITAWVPFAVIFFGIRDASAFFLIALGAFFPIVVNTAAGVAGTPKLLVRAARMLGIRRHNILPRVVLPSAMPYIFTGLRLGIGLAWVLVIVAEMMAVKSGLGFAMWDAYYFLRMDIIIGAMLSVGLLGFLSDLVIKTIGGRVLRWSRGL